MSAADQSAQRAADYAEQAAAVAAKLKAGTWESVHSLALLSIAHSLLSSAPASQPPSR